MNAFATLFAELDATTSTHAKVAARQGYLAQATSVPGVAQRTGALHHPGEQHRRRRQ